MWAILIGAAQYVNSYFGIREDPNAKLVFNPTSGINGGALELRVITRKGAGILKGLPILLD